MKGKSSARPAPSWYPDDLLDPAMLQQLRREGKVVDGRPDMVEKVCAMLRETIAEKARMLVCLDGPPGVGKTGAGDRIEAKTIRNGILPANTILRIPLDLCLKTERDTPARAHLRDNPVTFWRDFMDYDEVRRIFAEALGLIEGEQKGRIHIPRAYSREIGGKHTEKDIEVNPDTALILVEGVRSIGEILGPDRLPQWLRPMAIMMHATAREAITRAALRDKMNGRDGISFEDLFRERVREYRYISTSLRQSVARADFHCLRFPKKGDFMRSLVRKNEEVQNGQKVTKYTVKQVLGSIDPDFLKELFPEGLPEILRIGNITRSATP